MSGAAQDLSFLLHMISVFVLAVVGVGVILWSFLSRRVRWDRFWIGLGLLVVATPVAAIVTVLRRADYLERNEPDAGYVRTDTAYEVDTVNVVSSLEGADSTTAVDYGPPETWELPSTPDAR